MFIALFESPAQLLNPRLGLSVSDTLTVPLLLLLLLLGYISSLSRTAHGAVKKGWGPICVACHFLHPHRLDSLAATRWIVVQALQGLMAVVLVSLGPLRLILLPAPAWALVLA